MIVWHKGEFVAETAVSITPADRGLTLADGVFDTLLAVDGVPQEAAAHFERLRHHAAVMGIMVNTADFAAQAAVLLRVNNFTAGRYALRTTITRGPGTRGIAIPEDPAPTIIMRATPASPRPDASGPALPVRLIVAQNVRRNEGSPLSRIKSLNYGDNIVAWREARAAGADDALMLNNQGNLACATASNIFVMIDGRWLTPPLPDGAMDGIVRARLLRERFATEQTITAALLSQAGGIILSNSISGPRPAILLSAPAP